MQIPVEVTDEMRKEAELRGLPVFDYVGFLIARGRRAIQDENTLSGAIERIRALHATTDPRGHSRPKVSGWTLNFAR
ncbi:MAG: hypothetical protein WBD67_09755 [Terracidiphilus sp.]